MASSPATVPHTEPPRALDHKALYKNHVNSRWVTFLGLLDMDATLRI